MTTRELIAILSQYNPDSKIVIAKDIEESDHSYGGTIYDDPAVGVTEKGIVYITFEYDATAIHDYSIDSENE